MNVLVLNSGSSSLKFFLGEFSFTGEKALPRSVKGASAGSAGRVGP